jgi:hypothetical protein
VAEEEVGTTVREEGEGTVAREEAWCETARKARARTVAAADEKGKGRTRCTVKKAQIRF